MSNAHRIKEQKKRLFGRQSSEGNVHSLSLTSAGAAAEHPRVGLEEGRPGRLPQ